MPRAGKINGGVARLRRLETLLVSEPISCRDIGAEIVGSSEEASSTQPSPKI